MSLFGPSRPTVVAFDIIETVFQIAPLDRRLTTLGLPAGSYRRVYAEALRDAMALACANHFQPFLSVMKADLIGLLAEHGLEPDKSKIDEALSIMRELPPHPDAKQAFETLRNAGIRIFALSNGASASTKSLLEKAGMIDLVEEVLSVEDVKLSKPRPEVYLHAARTAKLKPDELMLVACHSWDVNGAMAAGLQGGYVARERPYPDEVMTKPTFQAESLAAIADKIVAS